MNKKRLILLVLALVPVALPMMADHHDKLPQGWGLPGTVVLGVIWIAAIWFGSAPQAELSPTTAAAGTRAQLEAGKNARVRLVNNRFGSQAPWLKAGDGLDLEAEGNGTSEENNAS